MIYYIIERRNNNILDYISLPNESLVGSEHISFDSNIQNATKFNSISSVCSVLSILVDKYPNSINDCFLVIVPINSIYDK
jgi:hypothetical protein